MKPTLFITSLVCLFLSGCSSTLLPEKERYAAYENFKEEASLEQVDRIHAVNLNRWTALGEQHLILYRGANKPYLVTLKKRCFDLDHALGIKVQSFGSSLSAGTDSISVIDGYEIRCFIDSIHKISPEQKKSLVKLRRKDVEYKETSAES